MSSKTTKQLANCTVRHVANPARPSSLLIHRHTHTRTLFVHSGGGQRLFELTPVMLPTCTIAVVYTRLNTTHLVTHTVTRQTDFPKVSQRCQNFIKILQIISNTNVLIKSAKDSWVLRSLCLVKISLNCQFIHIFWLCWCEALKYRINVTYTQSCYMRLTVMMASWWHEHCLAYTSACWVTAICSKQNSTELIIRQQRPSWNDTWRVDAE